MHDINIYCPLVLLSRHFFSRSKSEIGNILLQILHTIMSVSSNRNLDLGAGRGDGTLVVLTHVQSRKRRLNPLMDAFIAP